jgi:hypothetical protein
MAKRFVYDVRFTGVCTLDWSRALYPISMQCDAGNIVRVNAFSAEVNSFEVYLFEKNQSGWNISSVDDTTTDMCFKKAVTAGTFLDADSYAFFCRDATTPRNLFLGVYNAGVTKATIDVGIRWEVEPTACDLGSVITGGSSSSSSSSSRSSSSSSKSSSSSSSSSKSSSSSSSSSKSSSSSRSSSSSSRSSSSSSSSSRSSSSSSLSRSSSSRSSSSSSSSNYWVKDPGHG